jgi:hypothetical protein
MPKPPVLPTVDWKAVFASGLEWSAWLEVGESPQHRAAMAADADAFVLEPQEAAFVAGLPRPVHVVAIAEDWCGDVVRHAPVLEALARAGDRLHVRWVSREEHPNVFVRFLTNGGEAIPKFVFLSAEFTECGHWGPMPDACRRIIARGKACGDVPAARRRTSALYAADPARRTVVEELSALIGTAAALAP